MGEAARHVAAGGARPSLAIRVNPDVLAGGHPHISTGPSSSQIRRRLGGSAAAVSRAQEFALDRVARNHFAHRLADSERGALPAGAEAACVVRARFGARRNSPRARGYRRRIRGALHERSGAGAGGVCAGAGGDRAAARVQAADRAGARDRGAGGRAADARALREGKWREDIRDRRRGDERFDPAGVVRGEARDHARGARRGGGWAEEASGHRGARVRIRRFSGAGFAASLPSRRATC